MKPLKTGAIFLCAILFLFVICFCKEHQKVPQFHDCKLAACFLAAPMQLLFSRISLVENTPTISRAQVQRFLPEVAALERNWKAIRDEYYTIQDQIAPIKGDLFFKTFVPDHKWKRFYIKWYSPIAPAVRTQVPFVSNLLDQNPNIQLAMFSILEPNAVIKPHRGLYNGALRVHLGLSCPSREDGCALTVNGETYGWEKGKCLVWDDTFVHQVVNNSNQNRVILFLDVKRPVKDTVCAQTFQKLCNRAASFTNRET